MENLQAIIECLRDIRTDLNECVTALDLAEAKRHLEDMGDFDSERMPPEDITEVCAMLRKLPPEKQPMGFESGAPDMFGQLWFFNAKEAINS